MIIDELLLLSLENWEDNDEDSDVYFGSIFIGHMWGSTCLDTSNKVLAHVRDCAVVMNTTRALMLFRSCIESSRGSKLWEEAYDEIVRISNARGQDNKQFFIGMSKEKCISRAGQRGDEATGKRRGLKYLESKGGRF